MIRIRVETCKDEFGKMQYVSLFGDTLLNRDNKVILQSIDSNYSYEIDIQYIGHICIIEDCED